MFENDLYGWTPPKYHKQAVHVGNVFQKGDFTKNEKTSAVAVRTSRLGEYSAHGLEFNEAERFW